MKMQVRSLASLRGSGIWRCCEVWCRSQTWLGSRVTVTMAFVGGYSSDLTPSLGTSICGRCSPKKIPKNKKTQKNQQKHKKQNDKNDEGRKNICNFSDFLCHKRSPKSCTQKPKTESIFRLPDLHTAITFLHMIFKVYHFLLHFAIITVDYFAKNHSNLISGTTKKARTAGCMRNPIFLCLFFLSMLFA